MRLGQAYNTVMQSLSSESAIDSIESDEDYGTGMSDEGTVIVDSSYSLHKETTTSTSVGAQFNQFNINTQVDTSHKKSVDQKKLYALSRITSVEFTQHKKGNVTLAPQAKNILGLDTEAVAKAKQAFDDAKKAHESAQAKLDKENTAVITAKVADGTAKKELETAQKNMLEAERVVGDTPSDSASGLEARRKLSEEKTAQKEAEKNQEKTAGELSKAQGAAGTAKGEASEAKKQYEAAQEVSRLAEKAAAENVTYEKLQEFYQYFGDEYVTEIKQGRELLALSEMSRDDFLKSSDVNVGVDFKFADVAEFKTKVGRKKSEEKGRFAFTSTIKTKGLGDELSGTVKSVEEFEAMIKKYHATKNSKKPHDLDFNTESYDLLFKDLGIKEEVIREFRTGITKAKNTLGQLFLLREKAVRALLSRDFYKKIEKAQRSRFTSFPENLEHNPHNSYLLQLHSQLKEIIYFLNEQTEVLQKNIFAEDFVAQLEQKTAKGAEIDQRIETITTQLKERANKVVVHTHHEVAIPRDDKREHRLGVRDDYLSLPNVEGTTHFIFGLYVGAPKVTAKIGNAYPSELATPWPKFVAGQTWEIPAISRPSAETDAVLSWVDGVTVRMKKIHILRGYDVVTVTGNEQSHLLTFDPSGRYYCKAQFMRAPAVIALEDAQLPVDANTIAAVLALKHANVATDDAHNINAAVALANAKLEINATNIGLVSALLFKAGVNNVNANNLRAVAALNAAPLPVNAVNVAAASALNALSRIVNRANIFAGNGFLNGLLGTPANIAAAILLNAAGVPVDANNAAAAWALLNATDGPITVDAHNVEAAHALLHPAGGGAAIKVNRHYVAAAHNLLHSDVGAAINVTQHYVKAANELLRVTGGALPVTQQNVDAAHALLNPAVGTSVEVSWDNVDAIHILLTVLNPAEQAAGNPIIQVSKENIEAVSALLKLNAGEANPADQREVNRAHIMAVRDLLFAAGGSIEVSAGHVAAAHKLLNPDAGAALPVDANNVAMAYALLYPAGGGVAIAVDADNITAADALLRASGGAVTVNQFNIDALNALNNQRVKVTKNNIEAADALLRAVGGRLNVTADYVEAADAILQANDGAIIKQGNIDAAHKLLHPDSGDKIEVNQNSMDAAHNLLNPVDGGVSLLVDKDNVAAADALLKAGLDVDAHHVDRAVKLLNAKGGAVVVTEAHIRAVNELLDVAAGAMDTTKQNITAAHALLNPIGGGQALLVSKNNVDAANALLMAKGSVLDVNADNVPIADALLQAKSLVNCNTLRAAAELRRQNIDVTNDNVIAVNTLFATDGGIEINANHVAAAVALKAVGKPISTTSIAVGTLLSDVDAIEETSDHVAAAVALKAVGGIIVNQVHVTAASRLLNAPNGAIKVDSASIAAALELSSKNIPVNANNVAAAAALQKATVEVNVDNVAAAVGLNAVGATVNAGKVVINGLLPGIVSNPDNIAAAVALREIKIRVNQGYVDAMAILLDKKGSIAIHAYNVAAVDALLGAPGGGVTVDANNVAVADVLLRTTSGTVKVTEANVKAATALRAVGVTVNKENVVAAIALAAASVEVSDRHINAAKALSAVVGLDVTAENVEAADALLRAPGDTIAVNAKHMVSALALKAAEGIPVNQHYIDAADAIINMPSHRVTMNMANIKAVDALLRAPGGKIAVNKHHIEAAVALQKAEISVTEDDVSAASKLNKEKIKVKQKNITAAKTLKNASVDINEDSVKAARVLSTAGMTINVQNAVAASALQEEEIAITTDNIMGAITLIEADIEVDADNINVAKRLNKVSIGLTEESDTTARNAMRANHIPMTANNIAAAIALREASMGINPNNVDAAATLMNVANGTLAITDGRLAAVIGLKRASMEVNADNITAVTAAKATAQPSINCTLHICMAQPQARLGLHELAGSKANLESMFNEVLRAPAAVSASRWPFFGGKNNDGDKGGPANHDEPLSQRVKV